MRKIKFRARKDDISNIDFVYGSLIYDSSGNPRIQTDIKKNLFTTCLKGTEGQFVGVKDQNKVEIYEGDIVRETRSYLVIEEGDNHSEPITKRIVNSKYRYDVWGGKVVGEFSITWTGVAKITPMKGFYLANALVLGKKFDKESGEIKDIKKLESDEHGSYETEENFVKKVHKPRTNSILEVIGQHQILVSP